MTIDLKKFKWRAEVDWIDLVIEVERPTNFATVNRLLRIKFSEPLNAGPGMAATRFRCRFQDPTSWDHLEASVYLLEPHNRLVREPRIIGLELAIDAYSKTQSHAELIELGAYLARYLATPISSNFRAGRRDGSRKVVFAPLGKREVVRALEEEFSIYVGSHGNEKIAPDLFAHRIYVKTKDYVVSQTDSAEGGGTEVKGSVSALDPRKHRARCEATLTQKMLTFHTIDEARCFNLGFYAHVFRFSSLSEKADPFQKAIIDKSAQPGDRTPRKGPRRYLRRPTSIKSNRALNKRVYDALRDLSDRMNVSLRASHARWLHKMAGKRRV